MDQWFYDHFFRLRGTQQFDTPFILVRVNEAKLYPLLPMAQKERLHTDQYPMGVFHQHFYEKLVEMIAAQDPKLIIFTAYHHIPPEITRLTEKFPNLIVAAGLNEENQLTIPSGISLPHQYGFSHVFVDSDNMVRRSYPVYSSSTSLALRTRYHLKVPPVRGDLIKPFLINFRGPASSYPTVDAVDLYEGDTPLAPLKDRIVLIGLAESQSAYFNTPFEPMPRLEIQANVIDTFVNDRQINTAGKLTGLLVSFAFVLGATAIILSSPLTMSWLLLLALATLVLLTQLLSFSLFTFWMGVANPLVCIFGTHLLMLGYKLHKQEEIQWKAEQETEYLKHLDHFKNNFISLFSHDLKTPIAKISAITDRLITQYPELEPEIIESLKNIGRTNFELTRLITDILKVTKMESMPTEPQKEVIDLNRLVQTASENLRYQAEEKQLQVVLDLEPLFSLEGDPHLILEVIHNLIENAIKYSPNKTSIIIRSEETNQSIQISVIDQGPGIPADELPRVTSKFYRAKNVAETTKGSGLGLYLSKYFVELHGGKLTLESEEGKGTTVRFFLPIPD